MAYFVAEPTPQMAYDEPAPTEVMFEGKRVVCYSWTELNAFPKNRLRDICLTLREQVGQQRLPQINVHGEDKALVRWILNVQVALANMSGYQLTFFDFGVPDDFEASDGKKSMGVMPDHIRQARTPFAADYDPKNTSQQMMPKQKPPVDRTPMAQMNQATRMANEEAIMGAALARQRNQGSSIF